MYIFSIIYNFSIIYTDKKSKRDSLPYLPSTALPSYVAVMFFDSRASRLIRFVPRAVSFVIGAQRTKSPVIMCSLLFREIRRAGDMAELNYRRYDRGEKVPFLSQVFLRTQATLKRKKVPFI